MSCGLVIVLVANEFLQPLQTFNFIPGILSDRDALVSLSYTLERLVLGGLDFSIYSVAESLQHLSLLTSLQELMLRATLPDNTEVHHVVAQLTALTGLRDFDVQTLAEEVCTDEDGAALLMCTRHLPLLRWYGPRVNVATQSSLKALTTASLSALCSLNVTFAPELEEEPVSAFIRSLRSLDKLHINDTALSLRSLNTLCQLPLPRYLSLALCQLHADSAADYACTLQCVTTLVGLELLQCQLPHFTDVVFEQSLARLTRLEHLSILCDSLELHRARMPPLPMLRVATVSANTLEELDLSGATRLQILSVGSEKGVAFGALDSQRHLRELYLRTARPAGAPVPVPTTLYVLHLHASFCAEKVDVSRIIQAHRLRSLAIMTCNFEDFEWELIVNRLPGLRLLMLPITPHVSETHGVLAVSALTDLRKLELVLAPGAHPLHDGTIDRLKRSLKKCRITHHSEQII